MLSTTVVCSWDEFRHLGEAKVEPIALKKGADSYDDAREVLMAIITDLPRANNTHERQEYLRDVIGLMEPGIIKRCIDYLHHKVVVTRRIFGAGRIPLHLSPDEQDIYKALRRHR